MTDLPAEAVEAALSLVAEREYANALRTNPTFAPAPSWDALTETQRRLWAGEYRETVIAALTAAAPLIAAQATAQIERDYMTRSRTAGEYLQEANRLRAGIEALRDEWQDSEDEVYSPGRYDLCMEHAAALAALLPERAK